jgi:type III restriction enzyme
MRAEFLAVVRSARTQNGTFLRRYVQQRNRSCSIAIHPDTFLGGGYAQNSCLGSTAQVELRDVGVRVVDHYEAAVEYQDDPDPDKATWTLGDHRPRGSEPMPFTRAAHPNYSTADFNPDEKEFAYALDGVGAGVWARNPTTPGLGFSIPLPVKIGDSSRFFPDFLWWVDDGSWALDTTGRHLLDGKVRGKLIALDQPKVALVVRGHVDLATGSKTSASGWTLVRARAHLPAVGEHFENLQELLAAIRPAVTA